jgi:NTP pyrophosphatase (non-canonical NTP hydrolase)
MTELKEIQELVYLEYQKNGYRLMWNTVSPSKVGDIAELGLIITEVSEAIEVIRNNSDNLENLAEECADMIIRVMNFMSRKHLDVTQAILDKHNINMNREILHGKDV